MAEQEDADAIQSVYAAFTRGDIPAVLDALTDDVEWFLPGPPEVIPFAGMRRGREQVPACGFAESTFTKIVSG
jgi:ketosteroid isomerase-like protein